MHTCIPVHSYPGTSATHRQVHRAKLQDVQNRKRPDCPPSALLTERKEGHVLSSETSRHFLDRPWEASIIPSNLEGLADYVKSLDLGGR